MQSCVLAMKSWSIQSSSFVARRLLAAAAALLRAVLGQRLRSSCSRCATSVTTMSCGVIRSSVPRSCALCSIDAAARADLGLAELVLQRRQFVAR